MWTDGWVAFDTETTGLSSSARIVEIGVVVFEKGEPVHEWSQLLCPENVDWNDGKVKEALAVNKIDPKDLVGRPTFAQVLPDLMMELSHEVVVAHNLDFDQRMVNQELQRLGKAAWAPRIGICTKNLAAHFRNGEKGNRLNEVAARFNVRQDDAHRAAVDATTAGLVLAAMLRQGRVPREDSAMQELVKTADATWKGRHRW